MPRINAMGFVMGIVSALGMSVVGAFQETRQFPMHVVGAFMSFLGGAIYFIFQVRALNSIYGPTNALNIFIRHLNMYLFFSAGLLYF